MSVGGRPEDKCLEKPQGQVEIIRNRGRSPARYIWIVLEGNHGLLRSATHSTEVGSGEETGFSSEALDLLPGRELVIRDPVDGGEDGGPATRFGFRDEVGLREDSAQKVLDTQENPFRGRL